MDDVKRIPWSEAKQHLESAVGRKLETDDEEVEAIMELTGYGRARSAEHLAILKGDSDGDTPITTA